jgi:hypothetical protein
VRRWRRMVVPGGRGRCRAGGRRERSEGGGRGAAGAPVVGGNLARGPAMSIATTLLGTCERPVERRGARAGDGLWMAGRVGLAAAGLRALEEGKAGRRRVSPQAIAAWRVPRALFAEGRAMAGKAHAAVDVSDGLARDAGHLAEASGVQVILDEAALLEDAVLLEAAATLGASALDLALHGGEDYALVAAGEQSIEGFRRIGEVREGRGLVAPRRHRASASLEPRGFDHFAPLKRRLPIASEGSSAPGSFTLRRIWRSWLSSGALACRADLLGEHVALARGHGGQLERLRGCAERRGVRAHGVAARLDLRLIRVDRPGRSTSSAQRRALRRPRRRRRRPAAPARPRRCSAPGGAGSPASTTGAGFLGQPMTNTGKASAKVKKIHCAASGRTRHRIGLLGPTAEEGTRISRRAGLLLRWRPGTATRRGARWSRSARSPCLA